MIKTGKDSRREKNKEGGDGKSKPKVKAAVRNQQNRAPFTEKWINQCYEKLIFPNENCVKVLEKVNGVLPRYMLKPQSSEQKQQALFLLLGDDFTEHYFPRHKIRKEILEPPKMEPEQKKKYISEMKRFLKAAVKIAMEDCGMSSDVTAHKENDDLGRYLLEIRSTFKDGFTSHVAIDAFNKESNQLKVADEKVGKKMLSKNKPQDSDQSDEDSDDQNEPSEDKLGITYTDEGDSAGRTLMLFITNDDSKRKDFRKLFRNRMLCLPLSLRRYLWWEYFKAKETKILNPKSGEDVQKLVVQNFEKKLKESAKKQGLQQVTKSKNSKYIDSHLIEIIDGSPPLKDLDGDESFRYLANAVNMADVNSNNYSPVFCLLVIPIQVAYPVARYADKDYVLFVATQLQLVNKYCQLSTKEIFQLAEDVIGVVKEQDSDYLVHITNCLTTQTNRSRPLDFLPEAFIEDTKVGTKNYNSLIKKGKKAEDATREIYADVLSGPALYIRKWISQIFVGVLSMNGTMWAWDQLFLRDWSRETIKNIALCILSLIKPWMLRANMYSGARKVFIEEPSKIYTNDLRSALQSLETGSLFTQIPATRNFIERSAVASPPSTNKPLSLTQTLRPVKPAVPVLPFLGGPNFELNIDLRDPEITDEDNPLPVQERKPDSESEDEDEVPKRIRDPNEPPTPPESPPPPLTEVAWRPPEVNASSKTCGVSDPFDCYVDYVRFLPDHIRICKVIGRILNSGLPKEAVTDIQAYPRLESFQRSPTFKFKLPVNADQTKMSNKTTIIFKVYGFEEDSRKVVVVGSCIFGLFSLVKSKFQLKVGGHQIRLRVGGPNPSAKLQDLEETDMDSNLPIPGTTLCIRVLAASQIYDPIPKYEEGFYESRAAEPTKTEKRLYEHYTSMENYGIETVGDALRDIRRNKKQSELEDGPLLQQYMEKLLDQKSMQKKSKSIVPDMDFSRYVMYESTYGVNICIQAAFGLPANVEGYYTHALGEYIPSRVSKANISKNEWENMRVLTKRIDLTSPQRSPNWLDFKTTIYPPYDENGILLIRIFGITLEYIPTEEESDEADDADPLGNLQDAVNATEGDDANDDRPSEGVIKPIDKDSFFIDYDEPLAWSVLQIFDNEYAVCGIHRLAVFEGEPSNEVLQEIEKGENIAEVLKKYVNDGTLKLEENGLLEVEVWDGHMEIEDIPEPVDETQLAKLGIQETALEARSQEFPRTFADFVFANMSESVRSKGTASNKFVKESYIFQNEASDQFITSLNKALRYVKKEEIK